MDSVKRWTEAQAYELGFWDGVARKVDTGAVSDLGWYRWRADQLVQRLDNLGLQRLTTGDAAVVEVGSGPVGVSTFFPGAERVAVDPLMDQYARHPAFASARDPDVKYLQGRGEQLPCLSGHYDLAIIENCIDHVQDVTSVMRELSRVLKPDGVLYLTVNNRTRAGYYVHRVLSRLRIDRGHPHTFTPDRTVERVCRSGFRPLDTDIGSYRQALREDLTAEDLRSRLKAVLGVSEYVVSVVAARDARRARR